MEDQNKKSLQFLVAVNVVENEGEDNEKILEKGDIIHFCSYENVSCLNLEEFPNKDNHEVNTIIAEFQCEASTYFADHNKLYANAVYIMFDEYLKGNLFDGEYLEHEFLDISFDKEKNVVNFEIIFVNVSKKEEKIIQRVFG